VDTIQVLGQDAENEAKGTIPLLRMVIRQAAERAYCGRGDPSVFAGIIAAAVTRDLVEAAYREAEVVASRNGGLQPQDQSLIPGRDVAGATSEPAAGPETMACEPPSIVMPPTNSVGGIRLENHGAPGKWPSMKRPPVRR
jgi:hypothetical protein